MTLNKYTKKELIWIIETMQGNAERALELMKDFEDEERSPYCQIGCAEHTLKMMNDTDEIQRIVEFRKLVEI